MKENKFQTKLKKVLESQCAFVINFHGHSLQRSGLPDLEVIHKRWVGFLELKMNKNGASPLQKSVAAAIELRGTPVYVFRCVEHRVTGMYTSVIDPPLVYTIEDFEGNIIADVDKLKGLLDILAGLSTQLVGPAICKSCGYKRRDDGLCSRCDFRFDK